MKNLVLNNIKNGENAKRIIVVTHYGTFHSDDVLATSLLAHYVGKNASVDVVRVNHQADVVKIKEFLEKGGVEVFIVDVGREYNPSERFFDHHQFDPNENPNAAAGLIYQYLLDNGFINEFEQEELEPLVDMVDANDIGKWEGLYQGTFPWMVSLHNGEDIYSPQQNARFVDMVRETVKILEDISSRAAVKIGTLENLRTSKEVLPGVLEMPTYLPGWQDVIFSIPELDHIDLVIWYDESQKVWKIQQVPDAKGSFGRRGRKVRWNNPLPKGATFIHKGEFFGVFTNKEDLLEYIKTL